MHKKITAIILLALFVFSSFPSTVFASDAEYSYTLDEGSNATLTAYNGDETALAIPSSIDGHTVTALGEQLFYAAELTEVTIPNTVKEIKNEAFVRNSFESIRIPGSVEIIGDEVFSYNSLLKTVNIGKGVLSIGEKAFYRCTALESINVDEGAEYLSSVDGVLLANNATELVTYPSGKSGESYTVPDSVTELRAYSLESTGIKSLNLNKAVKAAAYFNKGTELTEIIAPYTFQTLGCATISKTCTCSFFNPRCSINFDVSSGGYNVTLIGYNDSSAQHEAECLNGKNGKFTFISLEEESDGYRYEVINGQATVNSYEGEGETLEIPSVLGGAPVTKIGKEAFSGSADIKTLIIPDTVTEIGENAFNGCTGITDLYFPCSAKIPGKTGAFGGCDNIENITITKGNGVMPNSMTFQFFIISTSSYYKSYPWNFSENLKSLTLEEGIKSIGSAAFAYHTEFESFTLPASVEYISTSAFSNCTNLKEIKIDSENEALCDIDGVVFSKDKKILYLYPPGKDDEFYSVPAQTEEIVEKAFADNKLKVLFIGKDVKNISLNAIYNKDTLEEITVHQGNGCYSSEEGVLFNKDKTELVYYPPGKSGGQYTVPESVKTIGEYAFYKNSNLSTITLPDGLERIESDAFRNATKLSSLSIPKTVKYIGAYAFHSNSSLKTLTCYSYDCEFENGSLNFSSVTIKGCYGSTAQEYATEHKLTYSSWSHSFQKAVDEEGAPILVCSLCGFSKPDDSNHSASHTVNDTTVSPTCTSGGYTKHVCADCGYTYTDGITDALGHDYAETVTEPTCTEKGYTEHVCSRCKDTYKDKYTDALGHLSVFDNAVPASCVNEGKTAGSHCSRCKEILTEQERIEKTEHTFSDYELTKEATCTDNGEMTRVCTVCGYTEIKKTDKAEHGFSPVITKKASRLQSGKKEYRCKNCNELQKTESIAKIKSVRITSQLFTYTGKALKGPQIIITDAESKLVSPSDYSMTYYSRGNSKRVSSLKNIGQYKAVVNYKNGYEGNDTFYISVIPKAPKIKKAVRKKNRATLKWKKAKGISGYQIVISENKSFTKNTRILNAKKSKKSKVIKKLKRKKKYYVKIRSYKTVKVDGKKTKMYSGYSKIKKIKA